MIYIENKISPPAELLPWLTHTKLLTKKLHANSGDTSMAILQEKIIMANWWERYVLMLDQQMVFRREIVTYALGDACWYARTIIPLATFNNHHALFDRLKSNALGSIIFGNNNIERKSICYYSITKCNIEFHWLSMDLYQDSEILWVRLSEFTLANKDSFYLIEILLPGLEKYT